MDNSGTPFVSYRDRENGFKATVMKFNGTSWETCGTNGFSPGVIYDPSFKLDSQGVPYVAFVDGAHSEKASVMNFANPGWEFVGSPGFSEGIPDNPSIAIHGTSRIYIAYSDRNNAHKVIVKYYAIPDCNIGQNIHEALIINWNPTESATGYKVYLGTNNPPDNIADGTDVGGDTAFIFYPTHNYHHYFWRVVPYNEVGPAEDCEVNEFVFRRLSTTSVPFPWWSVALAIGLISLLVVVRIWRE